MNTHRVAVTLTEDGKVVLEGIPFLAGETLEIILLSQGGRIQDKLTTDYEYLTQVSETMTEWESKSDEEAYCNL